MPLATRRDHLGCSPRRVAHLLVDNSARKMTDGQAQLSAATRFQLHRRVSGSVLAKLWGERSAEAEGPFPRCSWLTLVPQKNFGEHFQNKEFFCVGAQTASPRMHEHSRRDGGAVAAGKSEKCYSNSILSLHLSSCFSLNTVLDLLF